MKHPFADRPHQLRLGVDEGVLGGAHIARFQRFLDLRTNVRTRDLRALFTSVLRAILRIAFLAPGLFAIVPCAASNGRRKERLSKKERRYRPKRWGGSMRRPGSFCRRLTPEDPGVAQAGPSTSRPRARSSAGRPSGPIRWPMPTTTTILPGDRSRAASLPAQRRLRPTISRS